MTVTVGVVGTGFGGRVVAPVFADTEGCRVVDVVSARDDSGVAALCDNNDVDLVCVHSPPFLHTAHVRRAIVTGHAVLCDKPFGLDASEAETLLATADVADCLHLLNFEFRYEPLRVLVRELVGRGEIGTPERVQWTHLSAGSREPLRPYGWLFDAAAGGGWVGAWGSHAVDFLRWTFGEVLDVDARCQTAIRERPDPSGAWRRCDAEDGFSATLRLEGDVIVTIDASFAAPVTLAPRLVIVGSEGILECVGDSRVVVRGRGGRRAEHGRDRDRDPHLEPMRRYAEVVRDSVQEGLTPPGAPTFADGLACAQVLDRLRAGGD
jgi:predicted dehydrogenase